MKGARGYQEDPIFETEIDRESNGMKIRTGYGRHGIFEQGLICWQKFRIFEPIQTKRLPSELGGEVP
jgi:hypothetical protein